VDKDTLTLTSLWIHIPLVTAWIGVVIVDVFVSAVPGLSAQQRGRMIAWFRPFIVAALIIILITGVWQTIRNPFNELGSYADLTRLRETTAYGMALFLKHGFVLATFILTLLVHFWLAPRLSAAPGGPSSMASGAAAVASPVVTAQERTIFWLSVVNLLACLGALIMTTRMVWELH
jgi:putative copper export protein